MHWRNISLVSLAIAALLAAAFMFVPGFNHIPVLASVLEVVYFPAIAIMVVISGHSPAAWAGWTTFGVYTLLGWIAILVLYAVWCELRLIKGALHYLDDAKANLMGERPDHAKALESIGQAVLEIETGRRRHLFLKPSAGLDLTAPRHLLGARALTAGREERVASAIFKRMRKDLEHRVGGEKASALIAGLHSHAQQLVSGVHPDSGPSQSAAA